MTAPTAHRQYGTGNSEPVSTHRALSEAVRHLASRLADASIRHGFLHHPDRAPAHRSGNGHPDIVVFADASPARLVEVIAPMQPVQAAVLRPGSLLVIVPVESEFVRFRIWYSDVRWRGAPIIQISDVLAGCKEDAGLVVVSDTHRATCALVFSIIGQNPAWPEHPPMTASMMLALSDSSPIMLEQLFGERIAQDFARISARQIPHPEAVTGELRRSLWSRAARQHPISTLQGAALSVRCAVSRWLAPTGLEVAILGADGVGKTSVCEGMSAYSRSMVPYEDTEWTHLYHRVLPMLGEIARRAKRRPPSPDGKHGTSSVRTPAHPLGWFLGYSYYTVDMWLSALLHARPQLARMSLLLHDRHSLEVSLDMTRYRYRGPKWLARGMVSLAPTPDLIIVIDAPNEVVHQRKSNTSPEESDRRLEVYRAYARNTPGTPVVDGSQPLDVVQREVLALIASEAARRTRQRWGLDSETLPSRLSTDAFAGNASLASMHSPES